MGKKYLIGNEEVESTWSNVTGKINKLKGPDGNQGPPGDIGDKGDDFKLPDELGFLMEKDII